MFSTYFTARVILALGALFSIVLSLRSDGKTFDCKLRALEDYRDKRHITVYVRRWKSEITELLYKNFFDDVITKEKYKEFASWQFRGTRKGVEVKLPDSKEWDYIVFFVPLSISGKLKSQLDVYIHRIFMIDFDEYVPLDGRYIQNEMSILIEFYKSVDRERFTTQLILLGNKVTPFCPCFDFFDINISITNEKTRLYRNGTLAVQIYANKEHLEAGKSSKFNDLIKGTSYEDYNEGGILNALDLKLGNTNGAEYYASFMTRKGEGTIYIRGLDFIISCNKRKDGILITDNIYNVDRDLLMITFGDLPAIFKSAYRSNRIAFESEKAFHMFEDILKKIGSA